MLAVKGKSSWIHNKFHGRFVFGIWATLKLKFAPIQFNSTDMEQDNSIDFNGEISLVCNFTLAYQTCIHWCVGGCVLRQTADFNSKSSHSGFVASELIIRLDLLRKFDASYDNRLGGTWQKVAQLYYNRGSTTESIRENRKKRNEGI